MVVLVPEQGTEERRVCKCGTIGICSPITARSTFLQHSPGRYRRSCRQCHAQLQRKRRQCHTQLQKSKPTEPTVPLPLGPFVDLLDEMAYPRVWEDAKFEIARRFGADAKVLEQWRMRLAADPNATMTEKIADMWLSREGSRSLKELWPNGAETMWVPTGCGERARERASVHGSAVCVSPGCRNPRAGERFCAGCSERLARVRAEYQADGRLMSADGGTRRRQSRVRVMDRRGPVCTRPGCYEPRSAGEDLCEQCDLLYGEED